MAFDPGAIRMAVGGPHRQIRAPGLGEDLEAEIARCRDCKAAREDDDYSRDYCTKHDGLIRVAGHPGPRDPILSQPRPVETKPAEPKPDVRRGHARGRGEAP
jgi:hypothetical protein